VFLHSVVNCFPDACCGVCLKYLLHMCVHVYSMVEKDPAKRPTASEALHFPVVLHQIEVCFCATAILLECIKIMSYLPKERRTIFISGVLFSPPSPTSKLRDRQLCRVVVNRLQIVIMDTSRLYGSWSASVRSYRIPMWTGPTGANLHDRCHDLSESGSA